MNPLNLSCVPFFSLQIGQHDIPAHRVVLAAASPYWMELFTSEEDQPTRKEVEIDGGMLYELNGGFQVWSLTQFFSVEFSKSRIDVKSAFSTNAQSRFASVVVDDVLGPPRLARRT